MIIVITKRITFRNISGGVIKIYEPGDEVRYTKDTGAYYVTPMGGIWHDEAYKKM